MSETEPRVVTLAERKARKTAQKVAAVAKVKDALREFVREHPNTGRFIVFGSAARGELHYDSDFDVIVDFPRSYEAAAMRAAEDVCDAWGIQADVHLARTTSDGFLAEILSKSAEIIR